MKYKHRKKDGFTLIELLMATAIAITCSTIVVAIITSSFRSSTRVNSQENLRQAGTSALSQVVGIVQYADDFRGAYKYNSQNGGSYVPTSCSSSLSNATAVDQIRVLDGQNVRIISCSGNKLILDGNQLITDNTIQQVDCNIYCAQVSSADPPFVKISIDVGTAGSLSEDNVSLLPLYKTIKMVNP